jgi:hypothetical protein
MVLHESPSLCLPPQGSSGFINTRAMPLRQQIAVDMLIAMQRHRADSIDRNQV